MKNLQILPYLVVLACLLAEAAMNADPSRYQILRTEAESFYREGSYQRAAERYEEALPLAPPDALPWVEFRIADAGWRAIAATRGADQSRLDPPRIQLEKLAGEAGDPHSEGRVGAEAAESLGDFWWLRRDSRNWYQGWMVYERALDFWAGSSDLEEARNRYLGIVWKLADASDGTIDYGYGYFGAQIPRSVLENALKITRKPTDTARLHYLMAITLQQSGSWEDRELIPEEFEASLNQGRSSPWYDDALFQYANVLSQNGRVFEDSEGRWQQKLDFKGALALYQRLLTEFKQEETRYYSEARAQVTSITTPSLDVAVSSAFLPGSEIQYTLAWRNLAAIDLALYPVDLGKDLVLQGKTGVGEWIQHIPLTGRRPVQTWTFKTGDTGEHLPGQNVLRLDRLLPPGTYVLRATGDLSARGTKVDDRDLILVTGASAVLKHSETQALVYACDVMDGSPIPEAAVHLWRRQDSDKGVTWTHQQRAADGDGLALFKFSETSRRTEYFVLVSGSLRGDVHPAFNLAYGYGAPPEEQSWRLYVFTDRPAYRPGEEVHWKLVARQMLKELSTTPARQDLEFDIRDPRGSLLKAGTASLNEFGSAWGTLNIPADAPLGLYQVQFWTQGRKKSIGGAQLFRMEEYRLPEFTVRIDPPEENGRKKALRLGDTVEASVVAEYTFGGPVANASVEVVVTQRPTRMTFAPKREFPWFYEDIQPSFHQGYGDQVLLREVLKTDGSGRAMVRFPTPRGQGQDLEYQVEARVTDASRREVSGRGLVKVSRLPFYASLERPHAIHGSQDKVKVDLTLMDINEQPVASTGTVIVTRETWTEIWIDPDGKEVTGDALARRRQEFAPWPPRPTPLPPTAWRLKYRGYLQETLLKQPLNVSARGTTEFSFTPGRDGYYRILWSNDRAGRNRVEGSTAVWVADDAGRLTGYHQGGLEIILDRDTFRVGNTAPVMISTQDSGRFVLFSVEGQDLHHYRLLRMDSSVRKVEVEVTDRLVPNAFLSAFSVQNRQILTQTVQVVVPPSRNFLSVRVTPDQTLYRPQEISTFTIETLDEAGKPVDAEVSFSLFDASVLQIQSDLAGDPRPFFFGKKKPHQVSTSGTMQYKNYLYLTRPDPQPEESGAGGAPAQPIDELDDQRASEMNEEAAFLDSDAPAAGGRRDLRRLQAAPALMKQGMGMKDAPAPSAAREAAAREVVTSEQVLGSTRI